MRETAIDRAVTGTAGRPLMVLRITSHRGEPLPASSLRMPAGWSDSCIVRSAAALAYRGQNRAALMREAYVIEVPTGAAGVAVRIRGGFLFYASDNRFRRVDKRTFSNLRALHASLAAVALTADRSRGILAHAE